MGVKGQEWLLNFGERDRHRCVVLSKLLALNVSYHLQHSIHKNVKGLDSKQVFNMLIFPHVIVLHPK